MTKIGLQGMKFYAYHGYYEFERNIGNEFEVDVMINIGNAENPKEKIAKTYNYEEIYLITKKFMGRKYQLLETLAHNIADEVKFSHKNIDSVSVTIRKNNPPLGGKVRNAAVNITV